MSVSLCMYKFSKHKARTYTHTYWVASNVELECERENSSVNTVTWKYLKQPSHDTHFRAYFPSKMIQTRTQIIHIGTECQFEFFFLIIFSHHSVASYEFELTGFLCWRKFLRQQMKTTTSDHSIHVCVWVQWAHVTAIFWHFDSCHSCNARAIVRCQNHTTGHTIQIHCQPNRSCSQFIFLYSFSLFSVLTECFVHRLFFHIISFYWRRKWIMSKRNSVTYIKPADPKFLRIIKEQIGYDEGPNIDTKVFHSFVIRIE